MIWPSMIGGGIYIGTEVAALAVKIGARYDFSKRFSINGELEVTKWEAETEVSIPPNTLVGETTSKTTTNKTNGTDLIYILVVKITLPMDHLLG